MKLGITISSYKRPQYLKQCLDSIAVAFIPKGTIIFIVDDRSGSDAVEIENIIDQFSMQVTDRCAVHQEAHKISNEETVVVKKFNIRNVGIEHTLLSGLGYLFSVCNCDVAMNLDNDSIIKPNAIDVLLELNKKFPNTITSGFNTLSHDVGTKNPRHPIVEKHKDFVLKKTVGGINLVMNLPVYQKYVVHELTRGYGFDWRICKNITDDGKLIVVSSPSVVQHIGIEGSTIHHAHNHNPDIAHDF